jgi:hypothetical protein
MHIEPNRNLEPSARPETPRAPARRPRMEPSEPAFQHSAALDRSLNRAPDVRAEKVQRARELVGDVSYPPPQTMRRIAQLLAINAAEEPA